ncbi:type II secretory pathway component PulK [Haloferula luteola]|uniref:Type II secretory pathway component PulK n=1 Tax=Haloferula luteola TaxID=595692 RepID=A0A840V2P1_9BACT|nr:type II secretion system protein GspK [Haloferula luteola]MBB5352255.1 type II secretory pathway component PulK [Haloferula luteola]
MNSRSIQPRGVALLAVIWLIALLSFATVAAIRVVAFDLDVSNSSIHGFRAKQLAEMGIALGCNPAIERTDPILHQYSEETEEGFEVQLRSEGGKFNINYLLAQKDENLLKSMFIDWGITVEDAGILVDCLTDWIDENDEMSLNGAEEQWYSAEGRINQPFNRLFYNLDEMRLVKGMEMVEAYNPNWRDWFCIWSGGPLDLNEASAELIAVAADVTVSEAELIPETVRGPDGIRDTDDDQPFQSAEQALSLLGVDSSLRPEVAGRFTVNDTTTRIESIGVATSARRKITVIVRNRTGQPAVLERTEEVVP